MAGAITFNQTDRWTKNDPVRKITMAWTSDGSGAVNGVPTPQAVSGEILRVVTVPNGGDTAPTNNYGITLIDEHGLDVLNGRGASRSDTTAQQFMPGVTVSDGTNNGAAPVAVSGILELRVASAGAAKGGTVVLYVR